jgi:uncharacterized delta-60 repeat protein
MVMKKVHISCSVFVSLIAIFFIVSCNGEVVETTIAVLWSKTYGGALDDGGGRVYQTTDGGYIAVGNTESFGAGGIDIVVLKLNADGTVDWQKTYGGSDDDEAYSLFQTSDGGYVLAGQTGPGSNRDALVMKLITDGSIQWQNTYGGAGWEWFTSIRQITGGYIAVGDGNSGGVPDDLWVAKLDTNGVVIWENTYGGSGQERTWADIQETTDGGFVVAGRTSSFGAGDFDVWVLKLNAAGSVAWQKTYGGTDFEQPIAIEQTTDGGYIVAARTKSYGQGDKDVWILKLTPNGSVSWQKVFGGTLEEEVRDISQTQDGGYITVVRTNSFGAGDNDIWVLKLNQNGLIERQRLFGGTGSDSVENLQITPDDNYIIAGETTSFGSGLKDLWVLELTLSGTGDCLLTGEMSVAAEDLSVAGTNTAVTGVDYSPNSSEFSALLAGQVSTVTVSAQCGQ